MEIILFVLPVLAVVIFLIIKNIKAYHMINVAISFVMILLVGFMTKSVLDNGKIDFNSFGGLFFVDSLSIIMLDLIMSIGFIVNLYSIGYLNIEFKHNKVDIKKIRFCYIFTNLFILTMILIVTSKNMGIMWIAIEASTLASVFLVGFYDNRNSIEAEWKYIIICSVGITIALLGIIFLHLSSIECTKNVTFLDWTEFINNAKDLNTPLLRMAFIFIFIGIGTKAGLVPMHTWLPDAHSQAPSPISALLSGVLLNSALYAIIRVVAIVNKNMGESLFTGRLLMAIGILSVAMTTIFIITQKDYKRLLAYSSIEHMGIITLAIGIFTPLSIFGALFHMINHSFTKSMLFLGSGSILQKYETRSIYKIKNILKVMPVTGSIFFLGLFAISGFVPFSIFASELTITIAIFQKKYFFIGSALLILLSLIFMGIVISLFKIFSKNENSENVKVGEINILGTCAMVVLFIMTAIMGLYMPESIKNLILDASKIVMGESI